MVWIASEKQISLNAKYIKKYGEGSSFPCEILSFMYILMSFYL